MGREFGSIHKLPSGKWHARYRDGRGRRQVRTFARKADASAWLAKAEVDLLRGTWVDPKAGRITFREYAEPWLRDRSLAPRTRELYGDLLRLHLFPAFGDVALDRITTEVVRAWHGEVTRAGKPPPVTAAKCYRLLRVILNTAVDDGRIGRNPCRIAGAGIERSPERPVLSVTELYRLADAVRPRWRVMVLSGAFLSVRIGEALALQRQDVDLDRLVVHVTEQAQQLRAQGRVRRDPKADSRRRVSIPPHLVGDLTAHLGKFVGDEPTALLFTGVKGGPLQRTFFYVEWQKALVKAGLDGRDLHFHDLRHTGNTMAAATGASTAELMSRMGHRSARAALMYQHATSDRDRAIARGLSDLVEQARKAESKKKRKGRKRKAGLRPGYEGQGESGGGEGPEASAAS
jgi:integrase